MIGTLANAAAIALGGIAGLLRPNLVSVAGQAYLKTALGAFTIFFGLRLTWMSVNGTFLRILAQTGILLLALIVGRLLGRLARLQKCSNRLGAFARNKMTAATAANPDRFTDGFMVCTALFCAAPLGILGALHDGLAGYYFPLLIKAVMDGMAVMSFVGIFGWGVALSAVPVLVFQGTLTLVCARFLEPFLAAHGLVDSVNAEGGLLIACVGLLILGIRRIEVTDYLPALAVAPVLTHWILHP